MRLTVYGRGGGWDIGLYGRFYLYTDETGSYSFDNVRRMAEGHYQIWFNGEQEYGKVYENRGDFISAQDVKGDAYVLNVTVHAVTGSSLSAVIRYQDIDGSIKSFYSGAFPKGQEGHLMSLMRRPPNAQEYGIGQEYGRIVGDAVEYRSLAGGTYCLNFQYRRLDGALVTCNSPAFVIPPGEKKTFEYTIADCPVYQGPVLK